jgi:hypothetical protein
MKKRFTLFLLTFLSVSLFSKTEILQHSDKTIQLNFQLPEINQEQISIGEKNYTRLSYPGNQYLIEDKAPLIPYSLNRIAIPPGAAAKVQFQINEQNEIQQIDLLPLSIVSGMKEIAALQLNEDIYNSPAAYPGPIVEISAPYIYRNMQVVDLKIYPVQFYPLDKRVQIFKKISIQINLSGGTSLTGNAVFSSTEKGFMKEHILNYEQAQNWVAPLHQTYNRSQRSQRILANYDFSSGSWYKIPITAEGIYQISGEFLRSQGVNISNINTDQIQMFNYGGAPLSYNINDSIPADLNEIAIQVTDNNGNGILNENDVIYFYGLGINGWQIIPTSTNPHPWESYHSPYATKNYYLLTFNQNVGKRIPVTSSIQMDNPLLPAGFMDHYHFEEDHINLMQSGTDWYWVRLSGRNDQETINFTLPQNIAPGKMKIFLRFKGASSLFYDDPHNFHDTLDVSINGLKIFGNIRLDNDNFKNVEAEFDDIVAIHGGSNELFIVQNGNQEGASVAFDYFEIYFQRPLQAENNYLKINSLLGTSPTEFQIGNLSNSGNKIWDITQFSNVKEITPLQNGSTVIFQDQAAQQMAKEYFVFSNSAVKTVQEIEQIENTPNLRDPSRKGKLIIIVPDEFYEEAEALETFHESQLPNPIETERIKLSEIYREFSSCVPDPTAIRNFIKYTYNNWRSSADAYPEYVMLLGDGSYDYRKISLENYTNRIPTFQIVGANELDSRESDQYYVALSSNMSLGNLDPVLAIGRVPVNSINELDIFIDKVTHYGQSYLNNTQDNGWQNTLTFVADDQFGSGSGEWFHLTDTESLIRGYVPDKFDIRKIYLVEYETQAGGLSRVKPLATEAFINQLNRGTLMINFFGHGNPDTWAHEQLFVRSRDLSKINNVGKLPLWIAATCDWARFDDPDRNSLAEEMIWLKDMGGIGVIAASRPVYAGPNKVFVDAFYHSLFNNKSNTLPSQILGYGMLDALQGSQNYQKFGLFGDPSMKLADPKHLITITSVTPDTLKALSTAKIEAQITDVSGNPLNNFQGDAVIRVFDTKDSLTANNATIRYTKQEKGIFKGLVSVTNGKLTGQFIIPKSIKYDNVPSGRISIYAWSEDNGDANGYRGDLNLFGTESLTDNQGPIVDFYFEGQDDFFDGDYISTQPTMIVRLSDSSGINLTQEVGHRIELSIDGNIKKDVTEYFVYDKDSYQSGQLRYTLPALSPGNHSLTISAWDNVNNLSEREVNFRTIQLNELALEQVVNYPNPFEEDTHFTFQFQSPTGFGDVKIKIYTVTGRLIQELEGIAQPGFNKLYWDGRDRDGDKLANGVYLYKIIVDDGQHKIEKIEKLAVLR